MNREQGSGRHVLGQGFGALLLVVLAWVLFGCASTTSLVSVPKPDSDDQRVGFSYFTHRGSPYQLRVEIDRIDPLIPHDKHSANFHPRGVASVWRYRKSSESYDIRVSNDEPITTAGYITIASDRKLFYSGGGEVMVNRLSGIDERPIRLEMKLLPKPGVRTTDEIAMTVIVNAKIISKDGTVTYSEAETEHSWTVTRDSETEHGMQIAQVKRQ